MRGVEVKSPSFVVHVCLAVFEWEAFRWRARIARKAAASALPALASSARCSSESSRSTASPFGVRRMRTCRRSPSARLRRTSRGSRELEFLSKREVPWTALTPEPRVNSDHLGNGRIGGH